MIFIILTHSLHILGSLLSRGFFCVIKGWVFYRALRRKRRAAAMASGVGQIASKMNAMR